MIEEYLVENYYDYREFIDYMKENYVGKPIVEAEYQGKKVKLNDPIRTSENPNKKFNGVDGNFYFKDNMIERDLNILKINNGNSFVIN